MQNRKIPALLLSVFLPVLCAFAQQPDTLLQFDIESVAVRTSLAASHKRASALGVEVADRQFLREHFTGNLVQALEHIPGVRSMDIGSGFSKPVIRGMGFNRIAVIENGIKQEGQQWGADHGLEIDAFNAERVIVRKGPSSLMYGSDAMGGTIELSRPPAPSENRVFGELSLLGRSVNGTLAGSLMLGVKSERWYSRLRYSERSYGDCRVPTDTVVYLTQKMPLYDRKLKNTAGRERDVAFFTEFSAGCYSMNYSVSNAYQKAGFFPGAHGIPDASRLERDGSHRNIRLPYSTVNHFKFTTRQQYTRDRFAASLDLGFQNNRRTENSLFHTHYDNQPPPEKNRDQELFFALNTVSAAVKLRYFRSPLLDHTAGVDIQAQDNSIGGYSFLLPEYTRFTSGVFWISSLKLSDRLFLTGGLRYDYGRMKVSAHRDGYLAEYLAGSGYTEQTVAAYEWRSVGADRTFGDFSGAAGVVWTPSGRHLVKANIGRSFRLPGANELASNGVHHGTFRHEQGDPSLGSERGWQLDAEYVFQNDRLYVSFSPFVSRFRNYIYLRPTGEWSVLPHAGQIYRYTGSAAIFAGAEITVGISLSHGLGYTFAGDYVRTHNMDQRIPLAFSPPPSMRNTVSWKQTRYGVYLELESIARQERVARNESPTAGANILHAGAWLNLSFGAAAVEMTFQCRNIFDTKYYNHLSFYRHVEIPEPGRNFQLLIQIPFNTKTK